MPLIHGGDTESYRLEYGRTPLDFSANCNPLGVPAGVEQAICDAAAHADAYPDPLCRELRAVIAGKMGTLPQRVLCGNGAADLIYRLVLARKPKRALVLAPSFAEYELALRLVGCEVIRHPLRAELGFSLTEGLLATLEPGIEILFLCNPHNPTGLTIDPTLRQRILKACEKDGILLVMDECFNGFLAEPEKHTLRGFLSEYEHLLIIDAFTKLYGMAGVRLGYCLSGNEALLEEIRRAGQPWAVSSLAQAAGIAALKEHQYIRQARALIQAERTFLIKELQALGIKVVGGEANYIFFYTEIPRLAGRMREAGILIRDCCNYDGLSRGYYRIAVRRHDQNLQLLEALSALAGVQNE
ncbi:MAG: threonine-phosphate decarboxylase [Dethiobacteria bacterium]|jgi:threonine-phosphate decarboxylase|nr:pyridoxal phosphate-dependent class II aminotransferase [Bacillota bacterium]